MSSSPTSGRALFFFLLRSHKPKLRHVSLGCGLWLLSLLIGNCPIVYSAVPQKMKRCCHRILWSRWSRETWLKLASEITSRPLVSHYNGGKTQT